MARRGRDDHPDPSQCTDESCPRFPCRLWREAYSAGRRRGWDEGHAEGHAKGYTEGYNSGWPDGYAAGAASCR